MRPPLLLALLALAACKEEPRAPAGDPRAGQARAAAEDAMRPRLNGGTLRGVQPFAQAQGGTFAVCGRLDAGATEALRPWVALVGFERNAPVLQWLVLGGTATESARVFAEMTERCFEGGGTARGAPRPPPPAPAAAPEPTRPTAPPPAAPPAQAAPPPPAAEAPRTPTGRSVTTSERTPVNLRAAPGGGGEVIRTVPRGSQLEVFAEAPGGWLQVGQGGAPWGWVHVSVLSLY